MAKRTLACRVCGKQFVPCNKSSTSLGAFNYHSITCSPECGVEYLRRVLEARKQPEQNKTAEVAGQIDIDETVDVNATGENFENDVEEVAEQVVEQKMKPTRSKRNKQETNEEE